MLKIRKLIARRSPYIRALIIIDNITLLKRRMYDIVNDITTKLNELRVCTT